MVTLCLLLFHDGEMSRHLVLRLDYTEEGSWVRLRISGYVWLNSNVCFLFVFNPTGNFPSCFLFSFSRHFLITDISGVEMYWTDHFRGVRWEASERRQYIVSLPLTVGRLGNLRPTEVSGKTKTMACMLCWIHHIAPNRPLVCLEKERKTLLPLDDPSHSVLNLGTVQMRFKSWITWFVSADGFKQDYHNTDHN